MYIFRIITLAVRTELNAKKFSFKSVSEKHAGFLFLLYEYSTSKIGPLYPIKEASLLNNNQGTTINCH